MHALRLPGLPAVRGGDRDRRRRHQPLSSGRRSNARNARANARSRSTRTGYRARAAWSAASRAHRRTGMHRLHAVHQRMPGRRDHRRAKTDARRARHAVQRLRPLRRAVPGRLHRNGAGRPRMDACGCQRRTRTPRCAGPSARERSARRRSRCGDAQAKNGCHRSACAGTRASPCHGPLTWTGEPSDGPRWRCCSRPTLLLEPQ